MRRYTILILFLGIVFLITDPLYYILGPINDSIPYQDNIKLPDNFLWGTSSSAHQMEGNQHNDWTEWEEKQAAALAANHEDCARIPEQFCDQKTDRANYISGTGAEGYGRYQEDISLANSLGVQAYRFSIEWARIEPQQNVFDETAIQHYREEIALLRKQHMEPFVTLWHWTIPSWFSEKGGWCSAEAVADFADYVTHVTNALGAEVTYWITLNEPQVYIAIPYLDGRPPGRNPICSVQVFRHLLAAHKQAYTLIKFHNAQASIGIAQGVINFETPKSTTTARLQHALARAWNKFFLHRIEHEQDFIGINYFHGGLTYGYKKNYTEVSDLNWPLYPEGIYHVLMEMKDFHTPIYITENGLADAADSKRAQYIKDIIKNIDAAEQNGAPIKGYFYWSLTDSFEWSHGYWPRFGLINIDYANKLRTIRPSAYEYSSIIKANGF